MLNKISLKCRVVLYIAERNNNEWREKNVRKGSKQLQIVEKCHSWTKRELSKNSKLFNWLVSREFSDTDLNTDIGFLCYGQVIEHL